VNTYSTSDLRRSARARRGPRRALALTRTGAGVDLPGLQLGMSDDDSGSIPAARGGDRGSSPPAARGGFGSRSYRSEASLV
jgi:hypothetical protein